MERRLSCIKIENLLCNDVKEEKLDLAKVESPSYESQTEDDFYGVKVENPRYIKIKKKRNQVKMACVNCQKACKKCANIRPCSRCVQRGIASTCIDIERKPRKTGVKRGPYKKRKNWKLEILAIYCTQLLECEKSVI